MYTRVITAHEALVVLGQGRKGLADLTPVFEARIPGDPGEDTAVGDKLAEGNVPRKYGSDVSDADVLRGDRPLPRQGPVRAEGAADQAT